MLAPKGDPTVPASANDRSSASGVGGRGAVSSRRCRAASARSSPNAAPEVGRPGRAASRASGGFLRGVEPAGPLGPGAIMHRALRQTRCGAAPASGSSRDRRRRDGVHGVRGRVPAHCPTGDATPHLGRVSVAHRPHDWSAGQRALSAGRPLVPPPPIARPRAHSRPHRTSSNWQRPKIARCRKPAEAPKVYRAARKANRH